MPDTILKFIELMRIPKVNRSICTYFPKRQTLGKEIYGAQRFYASPTTPLSEWLGFFR